MCVPADTVSSAAAELAAWLQVAGLEAQITSSDAVPLSEQLPVPHIAPDAGAVCTVNGPVSPAQSAAECPGQRTLQSSLALEAMRRRSPQA